MRPTKEEVFEAMQMNEHNIYAAGRALGIAASLVYEIRGEFKDWWEQQLNPTPKPKPRIVKKNRIYVPYETKEFKFNPYIESLLTSYFKKWQE